eukprot:gene8457-282_t
MGAHCYECKIYKCSGDLYQCENKCNRYLCTKCIIIKKYCINCTVINISKSIEDIEKKLKKLEKLEKKRELKLPKDYVIDIDPIEIYSDIELELRQLKRDDPYYSVEDEFDEDDGEAQRILDDFYEENREFYQELEPLHKF